MMLYIKYKSFGHCSFRQEDFESRIMKTHCLTPWPTYVTNQNHLNNFGNPGTIPVEFGQISINGSRKDVV